MQEAISFFTKHCKNVNNRREAKYELCANLDSCKYRNSNSTTCAYGHSFEDIACRRQPADKYKVRTCNESCGYVSRCRFIHDDVIYEISPTLRVLESKVYESIRVVFGSYTEKYVFVFSITNIDRLQEPLAKEFSFHIKTVKKNCKPKNPAELFQQRQLASKSKDSQSKKGSKSQRRHQVQSRKTETGEQHTESPAHDYDESRSSSYESEQWIPMMADGSPLDELSSPSHIGSYERSPSPASKSSSPLPTALHASTKLSFSREASLSPSSSSYSYGGNSMDGFHGQNGFSSSHQTPNTQYYEQTPSPPSFVGAFGSQSSSSYSQVGSPSPSSYNQIGSPSSCPYNHFENDVPYQNGFMQQPCPNLWNHPVPAPALIIDSYEFPNPEMYLGTITPIPLYLHYCLPAASRSNTNLTGHNIALGLKPLECFGKMLSDHANVAQNIKIMAA